MTVAALRVRYEETDAMGVVYHANYLRYFEVARVELLRERGVSYAEMERRGYRLAVVEVHAEYRAPARFDDDLRVSCRVERVRSTRIDLGYEVKAGERLLCTGTTVLACIGPDGRPARLPGDVSGALEVTG